MLQCEMIFFAMVNYGYGRMCDMFFNDESPITNWSLSTYNYLSVCMYTCTIMYICIYIWMYICIGLHTCVCICVIVQTYKAMYTRLYIIISAYMIMVWGWRFTHLWFRGAMIAPAEGTASSQSKYHSLSTKQMGMGDGMGMGLLRVANEKWIWRAKWTRTSENKMNKEEGEEVW